MKSAACVGLCVMLSAAVVAQTQDVFVRNFDVAQVPGGVAGTFVGGGPGEIGVVALDPVNVGAAVQNAPYSAEAITEMTQLLADGNRIEQRSSATIARDSSGRTRREQHGIALGSFVAQNAQPFVTITDPSTGLHVTLNYEQRVAFRSRPMTAKAIEEMTARRAEVRRKLNESMASRSAMGGPGPGAPAPPIAGSERRKIGSAEFDVMWEAPVGGPPPLPLPPMAMPPQVAAYARTDGSFKTEALAPREIEGLKAEGVKTTMTIPAGAMGNAQAIEVTSEQWYSPELQIVLMTRRYDPRFGETVYRVINVDRSEPSADLFKVPSDFRIEDMKPGVPMPLRPDGQE
jgi:hypothetical protein